MDGWSLLKAIRSDSRLSRLPCIAITAYHNSTVKHEAMVAGFDAFLPKPLDDAAFARELNRVFTDG
jgi:CheY-like chemotaxis protein